jgi:signal transduction histidine kinase
MILKMIRLGRGSLFLLCLMGALASVLVILAALEYRWAGIVSEANRERMQFTLHNAFQGIRAELDYRLVKLNSYIESVERRSPCREHIGLRYLVNPFPHERSLSSLVTNLYVFAVGSNGYESFRQAYLPAMQFRPANRTRSLDGLLAELRKQRVYEFQPDGDSRNLLTWALTADTAAVIQMSPLLRDTDTKEYLIVELDLGGMRHNLLPDLIRQYLGNDESDYNVAVLSTLNPKTPIYRADIDSSTKSYSHADERAILSSAPSWSKMVAGRGGVLPVASSGSQFVQGFDTWELVAKRKQGSLATAAGEIRRKWLTINFIVLIVLALGMVTIVIAALRAQNFLRLQMEFVAGVSHELRTPVSVISSAADNLAEGVVRSGVDVREYGSLILAECRRLSGLVEQTLHFAAGRANYRPRNLQFLNLAEVIGRTLSTVSAAIETNGFTVEKSVDSHLPVIRADPDALSECLSNLISNAMKYGGESKWLAIRARAVETGYGTGVEITVEDRGIGIPSDEISRIFDPFFRGRTARSAQIHGTGLGLSLAQEAASSMGGRISVKSVIGKGSSFTLHIPAAYMNSSTVPVEALVES